MIIAIDGPSGAGKSTVAKLLSQKLGFEYVDTGAMYRALALKACECNYEINKSNENLIDKMLENTTIDYNNNSIYLDNKNVENLIRDENISIGASKISTLKNVRIKMVELQRKIAGHKNVVMDGRDIGTKVFPNADFKFFITASETTRAKRRYNQIVEGGNNVNFENVLRDLKKRDINDRTRSISPLVKADDAILIDTTNMNLDDVVKAIVDIIGGSNVL
ncbi:MULTISPECIES: (d)CMP kinase [unclassified Sedimentibacter]|uniref:(d)CMP kinase n=1 Tax=unclassified Sedimentibacter TaxID=2649220 RepID=UPI0027E17624|nr:(d)CMP kinase [Sedimentibacter sp. MB35-C1]WMJ76213.1 (d)CMP kinase [Sedimentibacter sp. MB35-C1]